MIFPPEGVGKPIWAVVNRGGGQLSFQVVYMRSCPG